MNLFGKKKAATPSQGGIGGVGQSPVDTIKMLRDNLITLEKREEHIQKKIEASLQEAKVKSQKKDKNGALFALKRKKMYEAEVAKLQGARITLDSQILALESAAVNIETFKAMKMGANTMKGIRGNIDADKVDEIMDEIQEEKDIHDSIAEAISRPGQDLFNDEDLLNELAELDALDMEEAVNSTPQTVPQTTAQPASVFSFPSAPTAAVRPSAAPQTAESEDERALRELEASMLA
jgi:charged multivesicular body protein 4